MNKPRVYVVVGPTAVGKSAYAVNLALKVRGEVISAYSLQIYKGLDIGSGKITKKEMQGVPHHLLDVADPRNVFTVSDYQKLAEAKIKEIISRGKTPIITGGTGFYIDAVTKNIVLPEVPPNKKLRARLSKKSASELFRTLQRIDPMRARTIDKNNPVRLIRAIEITKTLGKVPKLSKSESKFTYKKIGLKARPDDLRLRIRNRLALRLKQGMIHEVAHLHKKGLSWKRLYKLGLEYRYVSLFLQRKLSKQELVSKLETEIYRYMTRQMTWFRRDKEIKWFDAHEAINSF